MVMLCVPVGAMREAGEAIAADLADGVVVSDVGSVKGSILDDLRAVLPPGVAIVPGHPVAGTENSGPDAGFAQLFHNRWCILTPDERTEAFAVERLSAFWSRLGSKVEMMDPDRKSGGEGKSVTIRINTGGVHNNKQKK